MVRKLILLITVLLCTTVSFAQVDSNASHLRISFLTCGPGDEIWAQFGHNAIRVTDSVAGSDLVYNYGTFAFGEGFEIQFMRGKLLYYVSAYPYRYFLAEYSQPERRVEEQVLLIGDNEKRQIQAFLVNNAKEENRYYKYDFFFDNCATRLRDILPDVLGPDFHYSKVLPKDSKLTFRNIMDEYFYRVHFERVGCNLLLGSRIDKVMTDKDIMFLPDYVRNGLRGATINGKLVAAEPEVIFEGPGRVPAGPNWPFIIITILSLLAITGLIVPNLKLLGNIMSFIFLFVTGLLGVLMLVMWLGTDHQGCQDNFNVLWALPTNLILAFLPKRNKSRYAIVAIALIFVSLLLHIFRIQQMPLIELSPLLLALLFIFGSIVKRSK
ncbi:MAG: DUF4105 domain-containing protein [Chitinophagales bacterium]|nr:DUF4105 domain-containing protein [Chitinophagales bacterium]